MTTYWRPIPMTDPDRPAGALTLAGGWCWFDRIARIQRGQKAEILPASEAPQSVLDTLCKPRPGLMGLDFDIPRIMGIVNVTPDSFSDGGQFDGAQSAVAAGQIMATEGADILDIGGESTRPGSAEVSIAEEINRVSAVVKGLADIAPVSIDTRKAEVARMAVAQGARMVNDVSALNFDPGVGAVVSRAGVPICLMHAQGAPETMQDDPRYDDVLLDVYDGLADAIGRAERAGISRENIIVDPGIGFGKTQSHNLTLLRNISLFHGLGAPILLGASRKRFIGTITGVEDAKNRLVGSLSVAQAALAQGIQVLRVHDVRATRETFDMVGAVNGHWTGA